MLPKIVFYFEIFEIATNKTQIFIFDIKKYKLRIKL